MFYTHNPLGLYKYNKILVGYLPIHPYLFIYLLLDYPSHLQHFLPTVACYLFTSLTLSFLSRQPLLFRWQKMESTTPMPMAMATTTS
jgi:hypothetical protein